MVGCLAIPYWVYQGRSYTGTMDMSLYKCNNCPQFAGDWTWQCFARYFCELSSSMDACIFFDEGFKANVTFIVLELLALVAALLLLEKLLAFQLRRDYGSPVSLYAFAILMAVFHFLATVLWFGITGANISTECLKELVVKDGQVLMCASIGPALALLGVGMTVVTVVTFLVTFSQRTHDCIKIGVETGVVCRVSTQTLMSIVLGLQWLCTGLICYSIYIDTWVRRETEDNDIEGGLLECKNCDILFKDLGWDCFAGFMCDIDSSLGYCVLYENLKDAGRIVRDTQYISLAVTSLMFTLLWGQGVVFIIQGREYGFATLNYVRSSQFYAVGAVLFQSLAVILWFVISGVSYTADCSQPLHDMKEVPQLCSTSGPSLAIAASVLLVVTATLYVAAFWNRGTSSTKEVSLKYEELREFELTPRGNPAS
jgi:hypothetical protein